MEMPATHTTTSPQKPTSTDAVLTIPKQTDISQPPKQSLDIKKLEAMKEDLKKIVDSINQGTSYLSRAAQYWAEIPLLQKIAGGLTLVVPLFLLTALFQSMLFLCLSIFTTISYTAGSLLLDNHTKENLDRTQHLKNGIDGLADLLIGTISMLDKIGTDLGIEATKFTGENEKLATNIDDLANGLSSLDQQNNLLRETQADFGKIKDSFARQVEFLGSALMQQQKVSKEILADLGNTQKLHQADREKFKEELANTTKAHELATTSLKEAISVLTAGIGFNEKEKERLREKLNEMINDSKISLVTLTDKLSEQNNKMERAVTGHEVANKAQAELLAKNKELVDQLVNFELSRTEEIAKLKQQMKENATAMTAKDEELARLRMEVEQLKSWQLSKQTLVNNGIYSGDLVKGKQAALDHGRSLTIAAR